jgi:hypothetical protein
MHVKKFLQIYVLTCVKFVENAVQISSDCGTLWMSRACGGACGSCGITTSGAGMSLGVGMSSGEGHKDARELGLGTTVDVLSQLDDVPDAT